MGCRACASPGGGCQFLGTAATSQVVAEALGLSVVHSALAPSGQPVWLDMARRSARAVLALRKRGKTVRDLVTDAAVRNAMVVHAAFGGSTNLLLHIPAVAHAAGRARPTIDDWLDVNRRVPRLVDSLPERPAPDRARVPRRRRARGDAAPARPSACSISRCSPPRASRSATMLDWWEASPRRRRVRELLRERDGIDPDDVIMPPPTGAREGADQHRLLHPRQPRARGRDREEHGDRREARRRRWRLPAHRPGARSSPRSARRSPSSRARAPTASRPAP